MSNWNEVELSGSVSDNNSSNTSLGIGGIFTGQAEEILNCGIAFISVYSDVASATNGLSIQQSIDGTNWDHSDDYTVPAGSGKNYSINPHARYMRVVYTNGGTEQTVFRLQTICKANSKPSSHRIQDLISDDDDAELQKSVLTAKITGDGFTNIEATESGNLKTTDAENGLAIAKGEVAGTSFIHKFGNAPDFDTTDNEVDIWDGADDSDINQMSYQFSTSADIDSISSSDASDTQDIEIQGLDEDYNLVTQTITLNGQNRVALTTNLIRVFRLKNVNSTNLADNVYCFVNTTLSSGVPVDTTKVRAMIHSENNQTEMAVYTIPAGKTGYMRDWYAATSGASKNSNFIIKLKARPFSKVFQLKHKSALSDNGTSSYQHKYEEPEKFTEKTDIIMSAQMLAVGATQASISAGFDIVLVDD